MLDFVSLTHWYKEPSAHEKQEAPVWLMHKNGCDGGEEAVSGKKTYTDLDEFWTEF